MKNIREKMVASLLVCSMLISLCACGNSGTTAHEGTNSENQSVFDTVVNNTGNLVVDTSAQLGKENDTGDNNQGAVVLGTQNKGEYNPGVVLVKAKDSLQDADFGELEYTSADPLYSGSKWYSVTLADSNKTEEAVSYLNELGTFDKVDYDYVMSLTAEIESVDVSANPNYGQQSYYNLHKVQKGWQQAADNGKKPGGSSDVIIAVIDTGVDYNHEDLNDNIWRNTREIAGNGKDDDGNGYIDDVYGWDFVNDDNIPMDDNGHGTHVAGIIAAENNTIGGVGVAYNCKIMVIKAGSASGHFNNSDIAEAIQYAYMNGASVINMSFGGSSISIAAEEILENVYNYCVLVAAAGNDGACNELSCKTCDHVAVSYPAALPFVIGVMSVGSSGNSVSVFSNYDHSPYDKIEYEVYAAGENIFSCWPGNKYARLSGTSMSAPIISGMAAVFRSYHKDRDVYSSKYIQSQLVNTGTIHPYYHGEEKKDSAHSVPDIYEALINIPKPSVNLYDYYVDDSVAISSVNNGNGVVDAGETVRLYVSFLNRGGVASEVNVSVERYNGGIDDSYVTIVNSTMQLSDIGTYSVRESGESYIEIMISDDCPNEHLVNLIIRYTYKNGMDDTDSTVYRGSGKAQFGVNRGVYLPAVIKEDTVYTADRFYIVAEDVRIPKGVTVTFEEGCEIQFYADREYYNSPNLLVYGTLNLNGTAEENIKLRVSERFEGFVACIYIYNTSGLYAQYVDSTNVTIEDNTSGSLMKNSKVNLTKRGKSYSQGEVMASSSDFTVYDIDNCHIMGAYEVYAKGTISHSYVIDAGTLQAQMINHCYIECTGNISANSYSSNYIVKGAIRGGGSSTFSNNIILNDSDSISTGHRIGGNVTNNLFFAKDLLRMKPIYFETTSRMSNNSFCELHQKYAPEIISDYLNHSGDPQIDVYDTLADPSLLWPYVVSIELINQEGEVVTTVGHETIKVRVTFNRPMDTAKGTYLTFGTIEPYEDYRINGVYVSDTVWEGNYTLKAQIENGQNFLGVNNACAAEDETKTVFGEHQLHEFTIDTMAALAMNLQAQPLEEGIKLTWNQDDYDTLMGYNIYRANSEDGNYVRLNPTILTETEDSFLDDNAQPGKTYWYTFTVVLSDFSESAPAGKIMAAAKDTVAPSLYHTPVNQGYENSNLVISCTASDNVAVTNVTLYYRTVGETEWKSLAMLKQNANYSATIYGIEVTLADMEYYIFATDGVHQVSKGTASTPYKIVIKSADSIRGIGDVDGDGSITTKDALMLMQAINDDIILTDDQFKRADLNGDNTLNSAEALRILQYINGKVKTLEM